MDPLSFFTNPHALVVMDLDGTLIEERDYLFEAYAAISQLVAPEVSQSPSVLASWLIDAFETRGRQNLLQLFFASFAISERQLQPCLEILRTVKLDRPLKVVSWAEEILTSAKSTLAILTNGNPLQQANKISQSNLLTLRPDIRVVYANEVVPKPNPAGLLNLMSQFEVDSTRTLFIGDSEVDEQCARNAGVHFQRATLMGFQG